MKKSLNFFDADAVGECVAVIFFLSVFVLVIHVLQPIISLISTIAFCLLVTCIGIAGNHVSRTLTIVGIIAYIISWLLPENYGFVASAITCGIGVITWISGAAHSMIKGINAA